MVRGTVTHTVTLSSTSLWSGANLQYNVAVELDLARFTFPASGSNFSYWLDRTGVTAYLFDKANKVYKWDEVPDARAGEFSFRLVLPCTFTHCLLQAAILLFKKEVLAAEYTPSGQQMVVGLAAASSPT